MQLLPIFAKDILSVGPDGMGLLMGASAAGGLLGTFTAAVVIQGRWPRLMLIGGAVFFGVFVLIFAISTNIWLSLGSLFLSGIFNSLTMITNQTILQTVVPDELRGRVMGVFSLTYSLIPLGGLQVGILADFLGAEIAVVIGAVVVIVFSLSLILNQNFNEAVKNYTAL